MSSDSDVYERECDPRRIFSRRSPLLLPLLSSADAAAIETPPRPDGDGIPDADSPPE